MGLCHLFLRMSRHVIAILCSACIDCLLCYNYQASLTIESQQDMTIVRKSTAKHVNGLGWSVHSQTLTGLQWDVDWHKDVAVHEPPEAVDTFCSRLADSGHVLL